MAVSPLTGCSDVTLLQTFQTEKLISDWERFYQIDVREDFKGHETVSLFRCNETSLKFFYPFDVVGGENLYQRLQRFAWYYMADKWEFRFALRNLHPRDRILEIGSGEGAFLKTASERGLNVSGIELNEDAYRIANEHGLAVDRIRLEELAAKSPASFDAICSFQVLEHLENPREFISSMVAILKPGGKMILSVPDSDNYLRYQYNLLNMPPHHMTQWSKAAFISLETIFPIKVCKIAYEPLAAYHISGYLQAYRDGFVSRSRWARIVLNRYTLNFFEALLSTGMRRFSRGHTIYAQFQKQ